VKNRKNKLFSAFHLTYAASLRYGLAHANFYGQKCQAAPVKLFFV
jgi:hypothetical protein